MRSCSPCALLALPAAAKPAAGSGPRRSKSATGSRPTEGICSPARGGGEGRRREEGEGKGSFSRRVSAKQARDAELRGKVAGAVSKSSDRPKRTKTVWRHTKFPPGGSADYQYPHGARGQFGGKKKPKGGGRLKGGWKAVEDHNREQRAQDRGRARVSAADSTPPPRPSSRNRRG